ncbi:MAG: phosphatidate cytidylyltransferase [Myxococcota bacterium]|nr:phosphatidate cytidylyltransferase [Myxococcota bacterium]
MAEPPSNLALRLATAFVGLPIVLVVLYVAPPWAFFVLILAASLVGVRELYAMTHPGDSVAQGAGVLLSALAATAVYSWPEDPRVLLTVVVGVPVLGPLFTLVRLGAIETAALRACAFGFAPLFVAVPLTLLAVLRKTCGADGPGLVLLALGLGWFTDTGAYFAGRFFGRHKLYEAVSPKKTVEGAVGGLVASIVWALLGSFGFLRGTLPVAHALPLALAAGVLGQAGDLGESLLKRSTGFKDSGAIVPGHGGILDRVDAVIVTAVVVFVYWTWAGST